MDNKDISITQKRGCDRDSLSLILVKADVSSVSQLFRKYFNLKVYCQCSLKQYLNLKQNAEEGRNKLRGVYQKFSASKWKKIAIKQSKIIIHYPLLIWRYYHHDWSIVFLSGDNDSIAFLFSVLLSTNVITF